MRQNDLKSPAIRRTRAWVWTLAGLLLAGCGAEAYETRLKNTASLFDHMEKLNANLQGTWSDPETGISLRAPLQFTVLPPPKAADPAQDKDKAAGAAAKGADGKPAAADEEAEEEEVPDDRQPDYINMELPGLRGAFKGKVKLVSQEKNAPEADAFLYVMSNNDLADKPDEAKEFDQKFFERLTETLHVSVDPDKDVRDEKFPAKDPANNGFVNQLKYQSFTVTSPEEIAGYVRIFNVYVYSKNDIQIIVMFVLPADTNTSENFTQSIPLCLETLNILAEKLAPPRKSGPAVGTAPTNAI